MSTQLQKYFAASVEDVRKEGKKIVTVKNLEIGLFEVEGQFYAWRNMCPHAMAPVCRGTVNGTTLASEVYEYQYGREQQILRCPWHGWEFDLKDGTHLADPSVKLRGFPVVEEDGNLYVLLT